MMKKYLFSTLLASLLSGNMAAQNGYIYVHKKAISEVASVDFNFSLTGPSNFSKNFTLNDKPDQYSGVNGSVRMNAFDLGNSHDAGEGQLWTIISSSNVNQVHTQPGTLYTRATGSSQWEIISTVTNAKSVDGIGANSAIYSDADGKVFIYNSGVNSLIWDPALHSNIRIVDVASGGPSKALVIVGDDGIIYKYTGNGTSDSWTSFSNIVNTGSPASVPFRLDVHPSTQDVVFIKNNNAGSIFVIPSANPATATVSRTIPAASGVVAENGRDVAVSNDGSIYANYGGQVYKNTNGGWTTSPMSRNLQGLTGGANDQVWSINKNNNTLIEHTIYTRTSTNVWLDDERVRSNYLGNSTMIEVPAGTYKLTEAAVAGWNNSGIYLYDPSNDSTSDITNNEATINVTAGEIVHVVYNNSLNNPVPIPNLCTTNYVLTFGEGASAYGPAQNGFTAYHYKASSVVADGYYTLVKNNQGWFSASADRLLTSHTPTDTSGNGYFAIFNASYAKDDFFRQTVTGLSVGTEYEFAFWVADVAPTFGIRPNVTMGIVDPVTNQSMGTIDTGDIFNTEWKRFSFRFVATAQTAEIYLRNNSIGGEGNDLAIDDVSFAPAPPLIDPPIMEGGLRKICSNSINGVQQQYKFTNTKVGGTWSTDNTKLISINPTTGIATGVAGANGTAEIIYRYTDPSGCTSESSLRVTVGECVCYNPANTTDAGTDTKHGITLLKRAGTDNGNWPMLRKSGYTALESNTKGLVITRLATTDLPNIASPQEGMVVYDTTAKCLKVYTKDSSTSVGMAWKCFSIQTCP